MVAIGCEPPSHMAADTDVRCRTPAIDGGVTQWAVGGRAADRAIAMAEDLPDAWHPSESNKGVSEALSATEGKSTRVQCESLSKASKNGF